MSRRQKLKQSVSKKIFSSAGAKINNLNTRAVPMRGGFRI